MQNFSKMNKIDLLFVALAMSFGWGFRGNYGHEYGAMVPGALAAIAACLVSGRKDWYDKILYFGLFGAIGWAFGGQMSYGIIIGYTHSADPLTVFYGFGALFLEGFIWGGIGAGILALVVVLDSKRLNEMIFPFLMIFLVWSVVNIILLSQYGDTEPDVFYYFDTDWIAAAGALPVLLLIIVIRREISQAVSLMLHLTIGWLAGIFIFVTLLGLHLSPPRSDNWAGALGVFIGLAIFLLRHKYRLALYASLFVGLFSGIGFSTGQLFQIWGTASGIHLDWWKIMEQSFGLITGLGVALSFQNLRAAAPGLKQDAKGFNFGKGFALFFLLIAMTYVNFEKNVTAWLKSGMVDAQIFGRSPHFWFDAAYLFLGLLVIIFIVKARKEKPVILPETLVGQGYLLFLVILWWIIIGDLFLAVFHFNLIRLIVEGSFFMSAILLSTWLALRKPLMVAAPVQTLSNPQLKIKKVMVTLAVVLPLVILINGSLALLSHAKPLAGVHLRFGEQQRQKLKKTGAAMLQSEFIFDQAPFAECHASTIVATKQGLVSAWFGGTEEKNPDVGIWISRNTGSGWSQVVEIANGVQKQKLRYPCWNPVLFQPRSGPLMLFYKVGPNPREWWGMVITSDDGGATWSEPQKLPGGFLGPIKNKPVQLDDGSILCPSSTESRTEGWKVHLERFWPAENKWQMIGPLNDGKKFGAIQPTILTYPSGALQILCRSKQRRITECRSRDSGKTWSEMRATELPNPNSGIDAVTLRDGRTLLVYNHTERNRTPLNVAISAHGEHWRAALVLEDQPGEYSYPAVIQSGDGLVHITYTYKRKKIKHVVLDPEKLVLREMYNGKWPEKK